MNNLNQITSATREGLLTVAGSYHGSPTTLTVNGSAANRYADGTFASPGHGLVDGTNTFTAVATDALRSVTNVSQVYAPVTRAFSYNTNGSLTFDGQRAFIYDLAHEIEIHPLIPITKEFSHQLARSSAVRLISRAEENQLVQVLVTNAWKSEFMYDGKMRRRIRKEFTWNAGTWVQTNETRYVYDGNLVVQERNGSNVPKVTYTRGKDLSGTMQGAGGIGGLLARTENKSPYSLKPATHAYYHADANGNVTMLIDEQQDVAAKYLYSPYGSILAMSGPLSEVNLYRFSSKEWHPQSGLVYYLYRYYTPELQRWINKDPIGERGGLNLYSFVRNSPVAYFDPFGNEGVGSPEGGPWADGNPLGCAARVGNAAKNKYLSSYGTRYTHCMASCEIAKECGKGVSNVAGMAKELADLARCLISHDPAYCYSAFQPSDFTDNKRGRDCPTEESCEDRCRSLKGSPEAPPGPFNPIGGVPVMPEIPLT